MAPFFRAPCHPPSVGRPKVQKSGPVGFEKRDLIGVVAACWAYSGELKLENHDQGAVNVYTSAVGVMRVC